MVVLDASVILKWVFPDEPGSGSAIRYRTLHEEGLDPVAVPALFFYEAANTLALTPRLTEAEAATAWQRLLNANLDAYPPNPEVIQRAMELARHTRVSVYDAAYVALAEALGCDLTTADASLMRKLAGHPLRCTIHSLM